MLVNLLKFGESVKESVRESTVMLFWLDGWLSHPLRQESAALLIDT